MADQILKRGSIETTEVACVSSAERKGGKPDRWIKTKKKKKECGAEKGAHKH